MSNKRKLYEVLETLPNNKTIKTTEIILSKYNGSQLIEEGKILTREVHLLKHKFFEILETFDDELIGCFGVNAPKTQILSWEIIDELDQRLIYYRGELD